MLYMYLHAAFVFVQTGTGSNLSMSSLHSDLSNDSKERYFLGCYFPGFVH